MASSRSLTTWYKTPSPCPQNLPSPQRLSIHPTNKALFFHPSLPLSLSSQVISFLPPPREETMTININCVLLFAFASSLLLALSAQVDSAPTISYISLAPNVAPGEVTKFIESNMIAGRHKTEEYLKAMEERAKDPATSASTLECLKQCQEVYSAAMDDMKNSIDGLKSGDYYKASMDISAASTNVDTCQDCYKEMMKEDPQVKKFDDWVLGITSDSLAKLQKYVS